MTPSPGWASDLGVLAVILLLGVAAVLDIIDQAAERRHTRRGRHA